LITFDKLDSGLLCIYNYIVNRLQDKKKKNNNNKENKEKKKKKKKKKKETRKDIKKKLKVPMSRLRIN
jgi:hypothetical protein